MTPEPPAAHRRWFWAAVVLTAVKLWLISGQTLYAIGPAFHDDKLFARLAAYLLDGQWLGPYDHLTLAKGPMFSVFLAGVFWIGVPLLLAQQLAYAGACAAVTRSLRPWLPAPGARFFLYAVLLLNPMSYDAGNLSRLMRQNLYTPLALLVITGLVTLFARRRESWRRQAWPAMLAGTAFGCFWLTREESVWLLPAVGLLLFGIAAALGRELRARWRPLSASATILLIATLIPIVVVCALNWRHYGWWGTAEFRGTPFKDAYGALTRIQVGPELPQVPVSRQMREAAYEVSPTFAKLRPHLEGPIGDGWSEKTLFPAAERQMRGGWFVWAFRDAMAAAGLTPDAGTAMRHYRKIADEINAACDSGRLPAGPRRSGFAPRLARSDIKPLFDGAVEYIAFFIGFRGFTAYSPDSVGDYADLKPMRDIVGTHLSHAPRSPDPVPPTQDKIEKPKVDRLEQLGLTIARAFAWLGPLLLAVGFVRLIEAAVTRRPTFLLGLALALLASTAAYLAINILVQVTSFFNMSPAAMASAYPLYLLALGAIAVDTWRAWSRAATLPAFPVPARGPARWLLLLPAGAALLVFAARLREIHLYGSVVPFYDQWPVEARDVIAPWLDGTLRPWTFFLPHGGDVPVWTRLLAWLQVALTGRWDPLVQMTFNAALHTTFVMLIAGWVWRNFAPRAAAFTTVLLILGGSLPFAWQNITWGFQSQIPLALLCLFLHVHGSLLHAPGSRPWWLAQVAAFAGLFTFTGMWAAPLAVVFVLLWTGNRHRLACWVPGLISAAGLALALFSPGGAAAPHTLLDLLQAGLFQLGWPGGIAGAAALVQLPWLIHAFRLRGRPDTAPLDHVILALGLWTCLQAARLACTGITDYDSRQGDLLFVGVIANTLALTRLVPSSSQLRGLFFTCAVLWTGLVVSGLWRNATDSRVQHFHEHAAQNSQHRLAAVQDYLRHGDRAPLDKLETRWVLAHDGGEVAQLLDRPGFRALLPRAVNPATADSALGSLNRHLQACWVWFLLGGGTLLLVGIALLWWRGSPTFSLPALLPTSKPWPGFVALGLGLACIAGLYLWSNGVGFDRDSRWRKLLGGDQAVSGMTFEFVTPTTFTVDRLQGAAPLNPAELRAFFYGTALEGPEWTGVVLSSPFTLTQPWLVVPIAGYPSGAGSGLRVRLLDAQGNWHGEEIGCLGPNQDNVSYWTIDVGPHQGRKARLVLYDGRNNSQGWIAVAPPIPTNRPELTADLTARLRREANNQLNAALAIIGLVAFACAAVVWRGRRRGPRMKTPHL